MDTAEQPAAHRIDHTYSGAPAYIRAFSRTAWTRNARSFLLDEENRWTLQEQFNAAEPNAKLEGAITLDLDGKPGDEVVLVDTGLKRLRVLRKEGMSYVAWKEIELGEFPFGFARRGG